MTPNSISAAVSVVPPGAWAVGVSGGADSVALLDLLRCRSDLHLVVAHLDHQTRGEESDADERFVASLCERLHIDCRVQRRDALESTVADLPTNPSARYRRLRFAHFETVVSAHKLNGVILAHHADDQAETILQRLLRGTGYSALAGMSVTTTLGGMTVFRPLLNVPRASLRQHLADEGLTWREDASNTSPAYLRNRIREVLRDRPMLTDALLNLGRACAELRDWCEQSSPQLADEFAVGQLSDSPAILSRHAAARWLAARGTIAGEIDRRAAEALTTMCSDAASPARRQFPGGVTVVRRAGVIRAVR